MTDRPRTYSEAIDEAREKARRLFPSGEWTVETTYWSDGDFRVEAFHSFAETDGGRLRQVVEIGPFRRVYRIVEITETQEGKYIESHRDTND